MSASPTRAPVRSVVLAWLLSRAGLMAAVLVIARLAGIGPEGHPLASRIWALDRFAYWDSFHYVRIAELGYLPPGLPCCDQAFFPGYPALMTALAPLVGGGVMLAGLLVTLAAGTVAAVLLWHLLAQDSRGGPRAAWRALVLLALAPCGFFLVAVYTEALFLALALGAWLAASHRRWWLAGLLVAGCTLVRVNGLFLAAALLVMYAGQLRHDGRVLPRWDVASLGLPLLALAGYVTYLHQLTGSWNAWRQAEAGGWSREVAWPWTGVETAVRAIGSTSSGMLAASRVGDVAAVAFGVAVVGLLARQRRWAEMTFVGLSVGVVLCSTVWVSAPRYALTWFPAYLALATLRVGADGRARRWVFAVLVGCEATLLALATYAAATRHWVA